MTDFFDINGAGSAIQSISEGIDQFQQQNMSPSDIFAMGTDIPQTVGGIPGIGSSIPGLGNASIPGLSQLSNVLGSFNAMDTSGGGEWESVHYADDLNGHHPKFKFLFKVGFYGFGSQDFFYYVNRCDKPKVRFVHQDVNYYNFRTRVLTSVIYEPLTVQFLDEVGNSVNQFFASYLAQRSGTGQGNYGIDRGWGAASSSKPYQNGYSQTYGQRIVVEQIFINPVGASSTTMSNRFTFINPRLETFDFDELNMEESTTGSMATISFSYDAIKTESVNDTTIYSWGNTDLLAAGGTSGPPNTGTVDGAQMNASGGGFTVPPVKMPMDMSYSALQQGSDILNNVPSALGGFITRTPAGLGSSVVPGMVGSMLASSSDTVSLGIQATLGAISSGSNMVFGGRPSASFNDLPSASFNDLPSPISPGQEADW